MKILALDLGKNKTVYCEYDTDACTGTGTASPGAKAGPKAGVVYGKVRTTPQDLHDLVARLGPARVVFETCSAAGWVYDLAAALEVEVQVANPNHEGWRWRHVKKKTDRVDALKLAQLSAAGQLPLVHMPAPDVRQWRSLIAYRHGLVDRRTAVKNHIRAVVERQGGSLPPGKAAWSEGQLAVLASEARNAAEVKDEELWRLELHEELRCLADLEARVEAVEAKLAAVAESKKAVALLRTAPGVGPRLAELVVSALDDPGRFKSGKQVGSYAGLTPRQFQSGQSDRQGHISRMGNGLLREVLVEVAWLGLGTSAWMRRVYEQVRRGSDQRKKVAIVAVARPLLVRLWAMLRDGRPWEEEPAPRPRPTPTGPASAPASAPAACGVVG